jgi:hypothetical protein
MSTYYIIEPSAAAEPTPVYNYSSAYTLIANYLAGIDIDTTAMAESLALIAASLSTIATNSTTVAGNTTIIAEKQTAMETYQKKLKELGEGEGIHIISPFEIFSFLTTYRILVEEGKVLEWREKQPTDKEVGKALNDIGKYVEKIKQNIPRSF